MADTVGMMNGAFFVSKSELLDWMNDFFQIGYNKIEQTASGALHCQILDSIYPGKVPLHQVNFAAKYDYEYVKNFKVLQKVFDKQGIKKRVDVQKLARAKYQDNLEFCQWMKALWDMKYGGQDYDAVARREGAIERYNKGKKFKSSGRSGAARPARPAKKAAPAGRTAAARKPASRAPRAKPTAARPARRKPAAGGADDSESKAKIEELNSRLAALRVTVEGLEKERNFYFGKLREIEMHCQQDEETDAATKSKVLEILYATDDSGEFEAPAEEEEAGGDEAPADDDLLAGDDDLLAGDDDLLDDVDAVADEEDLTF